MVPVGANPGNELFNRYASVSAGQKASRNYAGIKDPLVDLLIARIVEVESREELITASRLLDRVLLNEYYVIPHWHNTVHRVSYDSRLARPKILPLYYGSGDLGVFNMVVEEISKMNLTLLAYIFKRLILMIPTLLGILAITLSSSNSYRRAC